MVPREKSASGQEGERVVELQRGLLAKRDLDRSVSADKVTVGVGT